MASLQSINVGPVVTPTGSMEGKGGGDGKGKEQEEDKEQLVLFLVSGVGGAVVLGLVVAVIGVGICTFRNRRWAWWALGLTCIFFIVVYTSRAAAIVSI